MCETDLCHKTAKREFRKERIAVTAREIGVSRNFKRHVVLLVERVREGGCKTYINDYGRMDSQSRLVNVMYIHTYLFK